MAPREAAGPAPGARELAALLAPLRFAARQDREGLSRLADLASTVRGAVERARAAGASDSPALTGLLAEAQAFDRQPPAQRQASLRRMVAHLAALLPVPPDLEALARRARIPVPVPAEGKQSGTPEPSPRAAAPVAPGPRPVRPPPPPGPAAPATAAPPPRPAPQARPHPPPPRVADADTAAGRAERRRLLATRLADLPGAHPAPRALLEERGRETVEAALEFLPKAWQDRTAVHKVRDLRTGEPGIAVVQVRGVRSQRMRSGKPMLKIAAGDETARIELVFFNPPPWRQRQFKAGDGIIVSGEVSEGYGGVRQMVQPEVEPAAAGDSASFGRIVPVYPGPADHQHPALRRLMKRLCDDWAPLAVEDLPPGVRERRRLVTRATALAQVHFPPPGTDVAAAATRATPAFRRLVFEELFFLQLALALRRRGVRKEPGIAFDVSPDRMATAVARLPFALTRAQSRVLGEIAADMGRPEPMNRLLQGDVGSGKTAVAFAAAMLAVQSGWQAAVMAPTEILAMQHARTFRSWLTGSGIEVALVAARGRGKEQQAEREAAGSGRASIVVGTHALLEEGVELPRLGLVVVDEQHRFGVMQRARLIGKGARPDVLIMTATPIPRTLALAFYGDLDPSKIDEMPPGRTPVTTRVFGDSQRGKAHEVLRRELEAGRQAYVVYPLVAESEKTDLADATSGAEELARLLAPHTVALLHGQMKADEKERVMARFRAGEVAVLVSTTVIEVGVDVPRATVMLVEHAERFGLSQLHQLRGRVGRGSDAGHCLLVAHFARSGDEARERLRTMVRTQDGFEIARADLRIRGPGELLGTRQAGQPLFEVADLYRDEAILEEAREEAFRVAEEDPDLRRPEHAATGEALVRWADRLSLARVG